MVMNQELADLLERSEIQYMIDRMKAIQSREGNPEGVEIARFGGSTAFYSRTMPWGLFNNVKGTLEAEALDDILEFYRVRERNFEFQLIPGKTDPQVLKMLAQRGYYQSGFHTTLYGKPRNIDQAPDGDLHIQELKEEEFDTYAEIHCLGTNLPLEGKPHVAANNRVLFSRPGWRYYLGFYRDTPAAVAVMYVEDDVATFTFAATLPEFRNKGLQQRLLLARIHEASLLNCRWVVGQCAFGSASHRNMERAGLRIGYTRSTWTKLH
ncbi:GNAT family N-acetyltransferase [Paenibacillus macerans]|uniref:GNAT family N-acetyltransferase n=1 Tax=Paenibacillus macerans TaxID=44252 RepID=UPI003D31DA2D